MWRTLLFTGVRWGEMTARTWSDVELDAKLLRLRATTTKTKRARTIVNAGRKTRRPPAMAAPA